MNTTRDWSFYPFTSFFLSDIYWNSLTPKIVIVTKVRVYSLSKDVHVIEFEVIQHDLQPDVTRIRIIEENSNVSVIYSVFTEVFYPYFRELNSEIHSVYDYGFVFSPQSMLLGVRFIPS